MIITFNVLVAQSGRFATQQDENMRVEEADFSQLESTVKLPEGYIIATIANYPDGKNFLGRDMGYLFSAQLLNQSTGSTIRGTGVTRLEALEDAVKIAKTRGF